MSTPVPLDADDAAALLATAEQRAAGVHISAAGTRDLQQVHLGSAEPDQGGE